MPSKTVRDAHQNAHDHLSSMEGAEHINWPAEMKGFIESQAKTFAVTTGLILLSIYFKKKPSSWKQLTEHFESHINELADGHILANDYVQAHGIAFMNWAGNVHTHVKEQKAKQEQARQRQRY